MRTQIQNLVRQALDVIDLPADTIPDEIQIERARDVRFGDFATNVALVLAKASRSNPRELATRIMAALPASDLVCEVEIAGPGFINFRLNPSAFQARVREVLDQADDFGSSELGRNHSIIVEFVSANPTGPLHVGHGRNAAFGDTVSNLLAAIGHEVYREYYINDAGRQADILAASVWMRCLETHGEVLPFPANAYPGDYVRAISDGLLGARGEELRRPAATVVAGLPDDEADGGDKEKYIDALIARMRELLGDDDFAAVRDAGIEAQVQDIRSTLDKFNVRFDRWFSERELVAEGEVEDAIARLDSAGHLYQKDGARWLRAEALGDEKDRVLVREDGTFTYFATDVAYHMDKLDRGFETLIDVWGADHHGYIPRVRASIQALTGHGERFEAPLIQFVTLASGKMGKRSGNFVTLRDLIDEVGADAARFFYIMSSNDQHLEFDTELTKERSKKNPVYYVQYAHARVCTMMAELENRGIVFDAQRGRDSLDRLDSDHEMTMMRSLDRFPEVVELAARSRAPHGMAHFLRDLANSFHAMYQDKGHKVVDIEDDARRDALITLCLAARQVIRNGLTLLGVSAPESM